LKTASIECREIGYNRSPNTRVKVYQLNENYERIMGGEIDSVEAFARDVVKKGMRTVTGALKKSFQDGMRGMKHGNFVYMRATDYAKRIKET
jgi:hypothetical protein